MSLTNIITIFIFSAAATFCITPFTRMLAIKVGAIDHPDHRKLHGQAVPYGGGLAIFSGFLLSVLLFGELSLEIKGFLLGATIITIVGFLDDRHDIPPALKFVGQIMATITAIYFGIGIDYLTNPITRETIYLESLSGPITFLWIIGITNAINFLDGLDGLAAGVVGISSLTLGIAALLVGRFDIAVLAFALSASSFAFLPYNFSNKLKTFMGDSGSHFLGFGLAVISVMGILKVAALFSMMIPLLVLAIPVLDTVFVIFKRIKDKRSITSADREHFHHRLVDMGLSPKEAVFLIYSLTLVFSGLALFSVGFSKQTSFLIILASLIILLIPAILLLNRHQRLKNDH